jgi:hypothetical protein
MIGVAFKRLEDAAVAKDTATPYAMILGHETNTSRRAFLSQIAHRRQKRLPQKTILTLLNSDRNTKKIRLIFQK